METILVHAQTLVYSLISLMPTAYQLNNYTAKGRRPWLQVIILADTAFGSAAFLKGVGKRRYAAIIGVRYNRKLADGRQVCDLGRRGQQLLLP